ncbi:MAG: hypothetical protein CM15mP84_02860 [Cellvibrionales bacterium]|nr:MAG: hypothetical protein CM15mP84_02860 [Cellvibrionales bacterium]
MISVDIQPEMLARIEQRKALEYVANVETVLGRRMTRSYPRVRLTLLSSWMLTTSSRFLEMGERLRESLKPGGQLVLVEYRAEDPLVPIKRLHKMSEAQVKQEMAAIGLEWVRTEDYLPQQHVLIFKSQGSNPKRV